jgi:phosphoglycerate dehydrogenase-like enzyme
VVGIGDLGGTTADLLERFGCQVTRIGRTARLGVVTLDEFRATCSDYEIIVLAAPVTPSIRHLVDDDLLGAMAVGTLVVNVARGALVDQDALIRAATAGRVTAILDVTDAEPLSADHPLWTTPNVTITPHVAVGR